MAIFSLSLSPWYLLVSNLLVVSMTLMSRTERKFCLSSTSCLAGLSDIFIFNASHLTELCVFWCLFTNEYTL